MYCCIPFPSIDNNTSRMTWVTVGVPQTVRELSWNCQGISHCLESSHCASGLAQSDFWPSCVEAMITEVSVDTLFLYGDWQQDDLWSVML